MQSNNESSFLLKCFLSFAALLLVSVLCMFMGSLLNRMVMNANGGAMPVAKEESERLGTVRLLLPPTAAKCDLPFSGRKTGPHTKFTGDTKLPFLADRFSFRLPTECEAPALPWLIGEVILEEGLTSRDGWVVASIGDFVALGGLFMFQWSWFALLLAVPFICIMLLRSLRENASP